MLKRIVWLLSVIAFAFFSLAYAQEYTFYYWDWCPHCTNVEDFFWDNNIVQNEKVDMKEIYKDATNREDFLQQCAELWITPQDQWIPMLLIESWDGKSCIIGDWDIIKHFEEKQKDTVVTIETWANNQTWTTSSEPSNKSRRAFFGIMMPAAISDSINPCAFTVMLLLLTSILSKTQSRRKAIRTWILFSLAVFITYLLMWIWLFSALATSESVWVIKRIFWILWILVWLANLKDFFRYGKWFVMEVPFSRRPALKRLIDRVTSPAWAFLAWIFVSLFLLPCSSGPYFTILWFLASQSKELHLRGYTYLTVYNLIFALPMIVITLLVGFGFKSVKELATLKNKNTKLIHLIVWLLMLGLWIYVLVS